MRKANDKELVGVYRCGCTKREFEHLPSPSSLPRFLDIIKTRYDISYSLP